jgi:hypothetical protein
MVGWLMHVVPQSDEVSIGSLVMNDGEVVPFRAMDTVTEASGPLIPLPQGNSCITAMGTATPTESSTENCISETGAGTITGRSTETVTAASLQVSPAPLLNESKTAGFSNHDDKEAEQWPFQCEGLSIAEVGLKLKRWIKETGYSNSALRRGIMHSWLVPLGRQSRELLPLMMPPDTVEEQDWELRQLGNGRDGTSAVSDHALCSAAGPRAWLWLEIASL